MRTEIKIFNVSYFHYENLAIAGHKLLRFLAKVVCLRREKSQWLMSQKTMSYEIAMIMVEKSFIFNLQIAIIYVAIVLCPQKFILSSKILILSNELREICIHINLCLKFQKISRINKNRENKYFRSYEYTRESTKISY